MPAPVLLAITTLLSLAAVACGEEPEWSLQRIAGMDSADGWTGSGPDGLRISTDSVAGAGALEAAVGLDPGMLLRVERNFIEGGEDGLENMMGMGMRTEDFTPFRAITFACKTELSAPATLQFRLYDRSGGWLDWTIPGLSAKSGWERVTLAVPPAPGDLVDLRRIGGLMFELRAGEEPVSGVVRLDDLQLITDTGPGLQANAHPARFRDFGNTPAVPALQDEYPARDVHMVLNMSPIAWTLYECDGPRAIRQLEQELARFRSVEGLEIFFGPETRRKIDPEADQEYLQKSREALVQVAAWCERRGVRFYVALGVEWHGFLPVETVEAVLEAAPVSCLGVVVGEASVDTNNNVDFIVTILERLQPLGKRMLYFQQSSYWLGIMHPHGREFRQKILAPRFRDSFVPMWENLLPSAQGLCLGTVMGLWRGGLVSNWGVSAQSWGYTNMNFGGTSDMPADWWARMFLTTVSAGATYIEIEPSWPFDGENTEAQIRHSKQWAHNLVWVGRMRAQVECDLRPCDQLKCLEWFSRLLRARAIRPPAAPERALSLSPVVLRAVQTPNTYKWGMLGRALDTNWWTLGDCPTCWEMSAQVPAQELFRYVYRSSHFYDQTFPETPYGLVSLVPEEGTLPEGTTVLETDGYGVRVGDEWLEPQAAADATVLAFRSAADGLPFRAEGCYLSVAQIAPAAYLACLVDSEERFPVGVTTDLVLPADRRWRCRDAMSGEALTMADGLVRLEIPAAGHRLLLLEG